MNQPESRPTPHGAFPPFDLRAAPEDSRIGENVKIYGKTVRIGPGTVLADNVTLVGHDIEIGRGTTIGRGCDLRAGTLYIGKGSELSADIRILVAERFAVAGAARLAPGVNVLCREFVAGRLLYLGDGATVGYGGTTTSTATVRIGHRVTIGQHSILNANCPIDIGDDLGTGSYLALWTHGYHFGHGPLHGTTPTYAPVSIGRNVWLGFHVTLLPGISVGDNSVVAAGSVVTRSLPSNVLAGGVPATIRKSLEHAAVSDEEAFAAVVGVLRTWERELAWKGCITGGLRHAADRAEIDVSLGDGLYPTRVVALTRGTPVPPSPGTGQPHLVLLAVDQRADLEVAASQGATAFDLRAGRLLGASSPVIEDLRDQLRRHAMPCGDHACFSSIEPRPFAELRAATSAASS